MRKAVERGGALEAQWQTLLTEYRRRHPAAAQQLADAVAGNLPDRWQQSIPVFDPRGGPLATREASGRILNALAAAVPSLIGGSADLAPSTKTLLEGQPDFSRQRPDGRNLRFGVREHAAGAIANGLALHGGLIPYASTFLVFSDYMRPALRLAAMMQTHAIFIFSHDSIALGEDGPTHQPVEHLASLRAIPGLRLVERIATGKNTLCCGAGGGMRVFESGARALDIARSGLLQAVQAGAEVMVSACPFCEMNLTAAAQTLPEPIPVLDIIDLVHAAVEDRG
jgi:transketolase